MSSPDIQRPLLEDLISRAYAADLFVSGQREVLKLRKKQWSEFKGIADELLASGYDFEESGVNMRLSHPLLASDGTQVHVMRTSIVFSTGDTETSTLLVARREAEVGFRNLFSITQFVSRVDPNQTEVKNYLHRIASNSQVTEALQIIKSMADRIRISQPTL